MNINNILSPDVIERLGSEYEIEVSNMQWKYIPKPECKLVEDRTLLTYPFIDELHKQLQDEVEKTNLDKINVVIVRKDDKYKHQEYQKGRRIINRRKSIKHKKKHRKNKR